MPDQIVWLSTTQVAKRLDCTLTNVGNLIRRGALPAVRSGVNRGVWRVREDVLTSYQQHGAGALAERRRPVMAALNHQRWHVKRGVTNPGCEHCR